MAGLTEFYCGWNEPSHASQFKWLEYTFNLVFLSIFQNYSMRMLSIRGNDFIAC